MKLTMSIALAAFTQAGLMTAAMAGDLPATTINVVGNLGITTQSKKLEAPFWTKEIEKRSGGKITVHFRPWNEMGLKGPEVFDLLSKGVMNIATSQLGYVSGAAPINDGNDLAGLSGSMGEFKKLTDAFFPTLSKYYSDKLGLHLLSLQSFQSQILYCKNKITGLKDLKGRRIRSSGASQADFIKYFGGSPMDVSFGEVQPAMEQGVIDCAITGTLGGYSAHWYETAKYLYTLPINFGASATVANAKWWDGLDPAMQEFLTKEVQNLSQKEWALNAKEDSIGIECNTTGPCPLGKPGGMTLVKPSKADHALRHEALVKAVLPDWVKRCGDLCKTTFNEKLSSVTGFKIN